MYEENFYHLNEMSFGKIFKAEFKRIENAPEEGITKKAKHLMEKFKKNKHLYDKAIDRATKKHGTAGSVLKTLRNVING